MKLMFSFFRCIGEAIVAKGLRGLLGEVPLVDTLLDVARDAWKRFRERPQARETIQEMAQATAEEIKVAVAAAVQEATADQPAAVRENMTLYLEQLPGAVRRSLRRPSDPSGRTVPPQVALDRPEALA